MKVVATMALVVAVDAQAGGGTLHACTLLGKVGSAGLLLTSLPCAAQADAADAADVAAMLGVVACRPAPTPMRRA